jgi:putative membrane protein
VSTLSQAEQHRVEAAVAEAEQRTAAEFAVIIARAADGYAAFSTLAAAAIALVAGGASLIVWPEIDAAMLFAVVAGLFVVLGLVLHQRWIAPRLVPASIKDAHAKRLALVQFASHVQGRTHGRVGVLLFVALAERTVEILVERGIADVVPARAWQAIVDRFVAEVRAGRTEAALTGALNDAATLLAPHFPCRPDDKDELPNRVTEI